MTTVRITEKPDLSPVLGELDEGAADKLLDDLGAADAKLTSTTDELNARGGTDFATEGVVLESEISGQTMIKVLVEDAKGSVGFSAELRPRNFYGDEQNPWQPGRPPMRMATDAWDVEGAVNVRFKTRVATGRTRSRSRSSRSTKRATRRRSRLSRRSSRSARSWSSSRSRATRRSRLEARDSRGGRRPAADV